MKKLLTISMAVLMTLVSMSTVFADTADTKGTDVTYEVAESYEWTAPADVTFTDDDKEIDGTVEVTKAIIAKGHELNIYVNGDEAGEFKLVLEGDDTKTLTYQVKKDTTVLVAGNKVFTVASGTDLSVENNPSGKQALVFLLDDNKAGLDAGTFKGTCTFEAKIEAETKE